MAYHPIHTPQQYGSSATWRDFNVDFFGSFLADAKTHDVGVALVNTSKNGKVFDN